MEIAASANSYHWVMHRSPGVLWRDGEFGVVLLAPGGRAPLTMTGTGRALWRALATPGTVDDLAEALAAEFGADATQVRADIAPVVDELCAIGAVEAVPTP